MNHYCPGALLCSLEIRRDNYLENDNNGNGPKIKPYPSGICNNSEDVVRLLVLVTAFSKVGM